MLIPKQLQNKNFKFVKIRAGTKKPFEENWAVDNNYSDADGRFLKFMKTAEAYGVVCGYSNLVIVDIENIEDKSIASLYVKHVFPETFTVQTGGGGWHLYYKLDKQLKKRVVLTKNKTHYGEIQTVKNQCLGPGSTHPDGGKYTILNDCSVKTISQEKLLQIVDGFYKKAEKDISKFKINKTNLNWNINKKLFDSIPNLTTRDDIKWRGPHPIHGSEGGTNFEIDTDKGMWYCFRCDIGGDAVNLIAMLEGLIKIDENCPTIAQFKKVFIQAKKIGIEKYGYPDDGFVAKRAFKRAKPAADSDLAERLFYREGKKVKAKYAEIYQYLNGLESFMVVSDSTGRAPHIYLYKNGYYRLKGENFLKTAIKDVCDACGVMWQPHYEDGIMKYIRTENLKDRDEIEPQKFLLNFNNGVYNVNTHKLLPHSPKYYFLYKIPWNYNPKAKFKGSKLEKYFKSTLDDKCITFSQELFGYCLYSNYKHHGIFYLYGVGGNGKSVWISLLETMLGNNNVSSSSIDSLVNRRFESAKLYGKLANICGEIGGKSLKDTDMLKRLSSGDRIQAEFKNKTPFDFKNRAKIITACNTIPYSTDKTDGWHERQYILPFLKKFRDTAQEDVDLTEKLTADREMESLLKWALQGLQRLLQNKKFSYPWDKKERYLMYQQNTRYFIDKFYTHTGDLHDTVPVKKIQDAYSKWCARNDVPRDSNNALGRSLTYKEMKLDRDLRRYIKKVK